MKLNSRVFGVIRFRRSVRNYDPRPIENEKLDLILEGARLAPSSSNSQPWRIVVVNQHEKIEKLAEATPGKISSFQWAKQCPIMIILCAEPTALQKAAQLVGKNYASVDIGIVGEHICLVAAELGIGTCWLGWIDPKKIKAITNIPNNWDVVCMISLGYPANSKENEQPNFIETAEPYRTEGELGIGQILANKRNPREKFIFYNQVKM
jgi:nitroreductase